MNIITPDSGATGSETISHFVNRYGHITVYFKQRPGLLSVAVLANGNVRNFNIKLPKQEVALKLMEQVIDFIDLPPDVMPLHLTYQKDNVLLYEIALFRLGENC